MARKTIQESKDTHQKDPENSQSNTHTKPSNNNGKIAVNVKDSSGKAFIIHVDPSDIPSLTSDDKPEFAGILYVIRNPATLGTRPPCLYVAKYDIFRELLF